MRSLGILIMVIGLLAIGWNTVHIAGLTLEPVEASNSSSIYLRNYFIFGIVGLGLLVVGAIVYRVAARKVRMNDAKILHFGIKQEHIKAS